MNHLDGGDSIVPPAQVEALARIEEIDIPENRRHSLDAFSHDVSATRNQHIGELLIRRGFITTEQLSEAIFEQERLFVERKRAALSGKRPKVVWKDDLSHQYREQREMLGEILVKKWYVSEQDLAMVLRGVGKRIRLGEMLVSEGVITRRDLDLALGRQAELEAESGGNKRPLGEILIELEYLDHATILQVVSKQLNIQYLDIANDDYSIIDRDIKYVFPNIDRSFWNSIQSLPIFFIKTDLQEHRTIDRKIINKPFPGKDEKVGHLSVVMADPINQDYIKKIEEATGCEVSAYLSNAPAIEKGLTILFKSTPIQQQKDGKGAEEVNPVDKERFTKYLNKLLFLGVLRGASDIHIEPTARGVVNVRMRIDGELRKIDSFPIDDIRALVNVIKIAGKLDITRRDNPQGGSFSRALGGHIADIRISSIPVIDKNEKIVLRLLLQDTSRKSLFDANLPPRTEAEFLEMAKMQHGIIFTTGPTGAGKTTFLHQLLQHIASASKNTITVEDPVEYRAGDFVNQTQVNKKQGCGYGEILQEILRQDPDVVLVGEVRDNETAQLTGELALTGHKVLASMHATNSIGAIVRLLELGVTEKLISSTVVTIANQRLVRKLCDCSETMMDFPGRAFFLHRNIDDHVVNHLEKNWGRYVIKKPVGCIKCDNRGYKWRQVVLENITLTSKVREMIQDGGSGNFYWKVTEYVRKHHHINMLFETGMLYVLMGVTSFDELSELPRGDYPMKLPQDIFRDANDIREIKGVDMDIPEHLQAAIDQDAMESTHGNTLLEESIHEAEQVLEEVAADVKHALEAVNAEAALAIEVASHDVTGVVPGEWEVVGKVRDVILYDVWDGDC